MLPDQRDLDQWKESYPLYVLKKSWGRLPATVAISTVPLLTLRVTCRKVWRRSPAATVISTVPLLTQGLRPWARRDPPDLPRLASEITCHLFRQVTQGLRPWARRDPPDLPCLASEITCHLFRTSHPGASTLGSSRSSRPSSPRRGSHLPGLSEDELSVRQGIDTG